MERFSTVYWLRNKLYLNITNRCSNKCYFCFRNYWRGIEGFILRLPYEPSANEVIKELQRHIRKKSWEEIVFCGFGEPTARFDCLIEVAEWIQRFSNVPVRVDTNGHGYLLNPERDVVEELKKAGVGRVSVSLNAHSKEVYNKVCRPVFEDAYESVLDFIARAKEVLGVEVTAVRIPELNVNEMEKLVKRLGVRFRLRPYVPCFY